MHGEAAVRFSRRRDRRAVCWPVPVAKPGDDMTDTPVLKVLY